MNEWISVDEKLPDFEVGVLATSVRDSDHEMDVLYLVEEDEGDSRWETSGGDERWPTHWMKLPELPKE